MTLETTFSLLTPPRVTRFGAHVTSENKVGEYFKTLRKPRTDVQQVYVNQDLPVTPVKTSLAKLKRSWLALSGTVGLGLLSLLGVAQHPSPSQMAYHNRIAPTWQKVEGVIHKATLLKRLEDTAFQNEFDQTVSSFLFRITQTMPKSGHKLITEDLLKELQQEMQANPDFEPGPTGQRIALSFVDYVQNIAKLPTKPNEIQIEALSRTLKEDFINLRPEYNDLSAEGKTSLAAALKKSLLENRSDEGYDANQFRFIFKEYLGGSATGLKLKDFAGVRGEAGAIRLTQALVSNPKMFKKLDEKPGTREAFQQMATELLGAIEYPNLTLAWALILLGAAGAAGVAFKNKQDLIDLATGAAHQELKTNMARSTLLIQMAGTGNNILGDNRRKFYGDEILKVSQKMVEIQKKTYEDPQYAEVRGFLDTLFPGGLASMPTAKDYQEYFHNRVYDEILNNRTAEERRTEPVENGENILSRVCFAISAAYSAGEFLPEKVLITAENQTPLPATASDREKLQRELLRLDRLMDQTKLAYVFRTFGKVQADTELKEVQSQIQNLEIQAQALIDAKQGESDAAQRVARELSDKDDVLGYATQHQEDATLTAFEAQELITNHLPQFSERRRRIQDALQSQEDARILAELRQVKVEGAKTETDSTLNRVEEEQFVQKFLADDRARKEAAKTIVKDQLAKLMAKRVQQTKPPGGQE